VDGDRIYIGAAHSRGFDNYGRMYCLNRNTGKELWSYDDGGNLKPVFSTPTIVDGRLYFGEGFHQDRECKMFCLDAATGEEKWKFVTGSHTESSPTVVNGKVYFGAGDDGIFCVNAADGKEVWHYSGMHVDSNPAVVGNRLYAGSGVGDVYRETVVLCLDATDGAEIWKTPVDLPAWGSANVSHGQVFFGLGNGDYLNSDAKRPAGAVLCVEARTGQRVWRYDVPDGVLDKPAVGARHVYFGCRDGHCYCLDRDEGKFVWQTNLGSPSVGAVTLVRSGMAGGLTSVYATASGGILACLHPDTGTPYYLHDIAKATSSQAQLFTTPFVTVTRKGGVDRRRIYFGTGLSNGSSSAAMLYCFEDRMSEQE
jgi:outer membrane protein assembly factor BamB